MTTPFNPPLSRGNDKTKDKRNRLLAALFAEAKKKGINAEFMREVIAKSVIAKRLSEATPQELVKVLEHVTGRRGGFETRPYNKGNHRGVAPTYESSLKGLKQEICDIAQKRFGIGWEPPLNALCKRFGVIKWQWLDLRHAKAIKETLIRLNEEGEYKQIEPA